MTWDVGQTGVFQPPEEFMPGPDSPYDIWSCLRLRGLGGRLQRYEGGLGAVNEDRIERDSKSETIVGTWICNRRMVLGPRITASSLVVLVFRAEDHHVRNFASRLMDYFNRRRSELVFDAMGAQPLFIYIALYQCFNSFTTFFYQYQRIYREVATQQEKRITSIFSRSFRLNKTLIHMSYCQEDILMHNTMLMKIRKLIKYADADPATTDALIEELRSLKKDLDDFNARYQFFSDRFKAALDLELSLSGQRLNWIMMLFTALTVLSTPSAFVAAIFSFIDSDPVWFLIAASAVLCISIALCLRAFSSIQGLGHKMTQGDLRSLSNKLPYQGPGYRRYRRPKGPDDGGSPPHDPGPKPSKYTGSKPSIYPRPHGPMSGGPKEDFATGHRPSLAQPPPPPSPPPRPPVNHDRHPMYYDQWNPPVRPHMPMEDDEMYWAHDAPYLRRPSGNPFGPPMGYNRWKESFYRPPPPQIESPIRPGPSRPVAHASPSLSPSSGDSLYEDEGIRRREPRLYERERGPEVREREIRSRERNAHLRDLERGGRAEGIRIHEEVVPRRTEERSRPRAEARRVVQEDLYHEGVPQHLAEREKVVHRVRSRD